MAKPKRKKKTPIKRKPVKPPKVAEKKVPNPPFFTINASVDLMDELYQKGVQEIVAEEDKKLFEILNKVEADFKSKLKTKYELGAWRKKVQAWKRKARNSADRVAKRMDRIERGLGWIFTDHEFTDEELA